MPSYSPPRTSEPYRVIRRQGGRSIQVGLPQIDTRSRDVKRQLWLKRPWRRDATGRAYLRSDGYYVRSYSSDGGWQYEIHKCGDSAKHLVSNGYPSDMAARFAAFDAITELLLAEVQSVGEAA